ALRPSDGSAISLGVVPWNAGITRTHGGMVVFSDTGPLYGVDLTGITTLATIIDDGDVASVPAFDRVSLFFSWEPTSNPDATPLRRANVGPPGFTDIAPSTTTRREPTVVEDGDEVFFVTGDPEVEFGVMPHPMGILKTGKTGGAITTLVPPGAL